MASLSARVRQLVGSTVARELVPLTGKRRTIALETAASRPQVQARKRPRKRTAKRL